MFVSRYLIRSAKSSTCRAVFLALSASAAASSRSSSISFRNDCERSSLTIMGDRTPLLAALLWVVRAFEAAALARATVVVG